MKHFIFTWHEKYRNGTTDYTIKIYQIIRNEPVFIDSMTDTYTGKNQLFLDCLEKHKQFPRKWFLRGPMSSRETKPWQAKDKGWYTVHEV